MGNTWPGGVRRALSPSEHESWNSRNYPGTRQMCCKCDEATGRCEEDSIYFNDEIGPLCEECYEAIIDEIQPTILHDSYSSVGSVLVNGYRDACLGVISYFNGGW